MLMERELFVWLMQRHLHKVEHNKKQGGIKVINVDKDNHKVTLGNVGFKLYSEEFNSYLKQNNNYILALWNDYRNNL